jgi:hypothetical protein
VVLHPRLHAFANHWRFRIRACAPYRACVFRSKSARHSDFMSATDSEVKSAIPI